MPNQPSNAADPRLPAGLPHDQPTPSNLLILWAFLSVGAVSFGGTLPMVRRMIVEQRRWQTAAEFSDLIALCQFLPGGNVINFSAALGWRFRRLPGAIAGLTGMMLGPACVVMVLGSIYARYQSVPTVQHLFAGLSAGAAGLIVSNSIKMIEPLRHDPTGALITAACFVSVGLLRWPLLDTLVVLAPLGALLHWLWRKWQPTP